MDRGRRGNACLQVMSCMHVTFSRLCKGWSLSQWRREVVLAAYSWALPDVQKLQEEGMDIEHERGGCSRPDWNPSEEHVLRPEERNRPIVARLGRVSFTPPCVPKRFTH
jgi:hypothetical protein